MQENKIMSEVLYLGELRCESVHQKSGSTIVTDAPTDNQGKGQAFSPTDLVATALAKCSLTIMGIKARDLGVDINGSSASVIKVMASAPRRIDEIHIDFKMRSSEINEEQIKSLERAALACPVAKSLSPDVTQNLKFQWIR